MNKKEINKLCINCQKKCKQTKQVIILRCPLRTLKAVKKLKNN